MAIYPQALMLVKTACLDYRSKKIDIEQLQYTLMAAADLIVAREEKQLRGFLENSEGELDLLRFTVDQESLFEKSLKVVREIENYIEKWE